MVCYKDSRYKLCNILLIFMVNTNYERMFSFMKKLLCTLLALAMLCSFMVVNVSAANEPSTYWETDYFIIDTDVELFCSESEDDYGVEYSFRLSYDSYGNRIDPDVGGIYIGVFFNENYDELSKEMSDDYDSLVEDNDNIISSEYTEDKFCGFDSIMYTYEDDDGIYAGRELCVLFSDGENVYYIEIESCSERDFYYDNIEYVDTLCDIVKNDIHFKNSPADDEKAEDTSNKTDKKDTNKDDDNKKDDETENKDTTTIIIVAIVAGAVVILGVTAMVVFGKKKKQ